MCKRVSSVADAYHAAVAAGNKRHKTRTKDLVAVSNLLPAGNAAAAEQRTSTADLWAHTAHAIQAGSMAQVGSTVHHGVVREQPMTLHEQQELIKGAAELSAGLVGASLMSSCCS